MPTIRGQLKEEAEAYYGYWLAPDPMVGRSGPEPPMPGEVELLEAIERFNKFPWDGGLYDQPHATMQLVTLCADVREEVQQVAEIQNKVYGNANQTRPPAANGPDPGSAVSRLYLPGLQQNSG